MITTTTHATALSDLRTSKWHIVARRKCVHMMGTPWSYSIPRNEIKRFHDDRDAGVIISAQRLDDDQFVVVAKLASR